MEVIHTTPTTESFVPLSTHQSQTPESFFSGPPVLYHHSPAATLKTHASELVTAPTLHSLFGLSQAPVNGTAAVNAYPHDAEEEHEVEAQGVDIWVSSEYMAAQQHSRSRKLMMINQATRSLLPFETSRPLNPIPFHFSARYPKLHPPLALPPTPHPIFDLRRP